MTMRTADDRLSRAASAIWLARTEPDPYDEIGYANDCGDLIDAGNRRYELKVIADAGYATPGEYNDELWRRMVGEEGLAQWKTEGRCHMSHRVFDLITMLEIRDVCPECGAALDVTKSWSPNYGGGWDTFYRCPACDWAEVCV